MKHIDTIRQQALAMFGFESLNPMQEAMLKSIDDRHDLLLLSPTGSGKTIAFLLPVMAFEETTLVIAPSRELVQQIREVWQQLHTGIRCVACYGGHDMRTEQEQLLSLTANGRITSPCLIVSTPGRLKDHLERGNFPPDLFSLLVIDEFDKVLELGFEEEMHAILDQLIALKQRIFTSATHAVPIAPWTQFKDYIQLDFGSDEQKDGKAELDQYQVKSPVPDKLDTLKELLMALPNDADGTPATAIVFANYREAAERIAHYLQEQGIESALYHGGLDQEYRDKALIRFRGRSITLLISTDLASRGLDIPEVGHVIHYHLPQSEEAWTHRNGRTARAGASGSSYIILGPNELLPEYISDKTPYYSLKKRTQRLTPPNVTVYIGRGKKEKISKGDVVGFFTKNGGLQGSDLGRIDVMDHCAYVAIRREVAEAALAKVKGLKIKGEKTLYKILSGS